MLWHCAKNLIIKVLLSKLSEKHLRELSGGRPRGHQASAMRPGMHLHRLPHFLSFTSQEPVRGCSHQVTGVVVQGGDAPGRIHYHQPSHSPRKGPRRCVTRPPGDRTRDGHESTADWRQVRPPTIWPFTCSVPCPSHPLLAWSLRAHAETLGQGSKVELEPCRRRGTRTLPGGRGKQAQEPWGSLPGRRQRSCGPARSI